MSQNPLVSIICTNYNKGDWIRDAIESFLRQKANFSYEIILIDDKSTDKSVNIIREYEKKYPNKIQAFYNNKNLGITKTWIKICKQAKGKYIARCDGDDYWIDDNKLQKQVDLLEKNKGSKWCNTDFDIIDSTDKSISMSVFKNEVIDLPISYEEIFTTKGFTMASTWLVDTNLMLSINNNLDHNAVDDTFNIQLDLFHKTKLTYLTDSTTVYRVNSNSDSHSTKAEVIKSRNEKLLKTQLEYIDKYKDVDYANMLKTILGASSNLEMLATERLDIIKNQQKIIEDINKDIANIKQSKTYRLASFIAKVSQKLHFK